MHPFPMGLCTARAVADDACNVSAKAAAANPKYTLVFMGISSNHGAARGSEKLSIGRARTNGGSRQFRM